MILFRTRPSEFQDYEWNGIRPVRPTIVETMKIELATGCDKSEGKIIFRYNSSIFDVVNSGTPSGIPQGKLYPKPEARSPDHYTVHINEISTGLSLMRFLIFDAVKSGKPCFPNRGDDFQVTDVTSRME